MKIRIQGRCASSCIYETEVADDDGQPTRTAVERAVASGASLDGASLSGARLDGASLDGARLDGASLDGASLDGANLSGASLDGASLVGARLDGASLDGARLVGANLDGANLSGAAYEGECACLFGTIANTRGCYFRALGARLTPDARRPAERWFLAIRRGDTPTTNPVAAITERWIVEWQADRAADRAAAIEPYADLLRSLRGSAAPEIAAKIDALIGGAA